MMKSKKLKLIVIICSVILGIVFILHSCRNTKPGFTFETTKVTRGIVSNTVTATGTIQAIKTVAVGTQVSGVIKKIYADFNSHVKKGQLLAELDKAPLMTNLESAQAALDDATAELNFQTANYSRIKTLNDKKLLAQTDYDQALYNFEKSKANVKTAKSNYDKARVNLDYATIYSPIDGVILNRAVDEGQTVAASFSTPTLFSIANDLTQMQVEANIDEADIGQVKYGQLVEFSVDAFPDMKFSGEVTQIRLQPVTTNNVVTYTVIVKAPNPDVKLMPGMTANIIIIVSKSDNVLIIPGKALRFNPDSTLFTDYMNSLPDNEKPANIKFPSSNNNPGINGKQLPGMNDSFQKPTVVWIKNGSLISPITVVVGSSDGINTGIKSGIKEGDEVIISMNSSVLADKPQKTTSPFMPKRPASNKAK
jgi:HlyD family secretion protein